jgi:Tfp pilus assembly protein PilF
LLDAEALRVVKTISGYKPGTQNGIPVPVSFTIPITFKLGNLRNDDPQGYFEKAQMHYSNGNSKKGDDNLNKAISAGSTWYIEAYIKRAELFLSKNEYENAQQDFESALQLDSTRTDLWIGRGKCLFGKKKLDEALDNLKKAASLNHIHQAHTHTWGCSV